MKQVPDLGGIRLDAEGTGLDLDSLPLLTSPFDEWALEEALLLKEVVGGTVSLDDPGNYGTTLDALDLMRALTERLA